jgi:hypothetical protein
VSGRFDGPHLAEKLGGFARRCACLETQQVNRMALSQLARQVQHAQ